MPERIVDSVRQFFEDHILVMLTVLFLVVVVLAVIIAMCFAAKCTRGSYGQAYYHSPTYVKTGNVLVPVGGGYYGDYKCDAWR